MMEFPAPDFIVEVLSPSTEKIDRGVKFDDYALHQIREYWIIDCEEQSVEQYILRDGEPSYNLHCKVVQGEIASTVITGFKIPVQAIFVAELNQQTLMKMI
jgi:Uma2 family endonuclease